MTAEGSGRRVRRERPRGLPAEDRPLFGGGAFGLFAEMLLVGIGVAVLSLPVVTALPAMAAGAAHVRRHVRGETDRLLDLWAEFRAAMRGGWPSWAGAAALVALLVLNLSAAGSGRLPGGGGVAVLTVLVLVAVGLVLLRAASAWRPGARWRDLLDSSARRTCSDVRGSGLLLLALGLCAVIVWMFAPLAVVVPGLLAFAAAAVEARRG